MASHYFLEDETLKSDPQPFDYYFKSRKYTFVTDSGVFSAGEMDQNTALLLGQLPKLSGSLLDMGCGYGCIGIILASQYNLELTQVDINPKAVRITLENCELNRVKSNVFVSDCYSGIQGRFDTIVINPPIHAGKAVIYRMYDEAPEHLLEGGKLFVVILKKHGAESTIVKLREVFGNCEAIYREKGRYVLCCVK